MGAPKVVMYASSWCSYCSRARSLLESKGVALEVIDVDVAPGAREEMVSRSGCTSVPQIFIGERHIGGSDELHELDAVGGLDPLLK